MYDFVQPFLPSTSTAGNYPHVTLTYAASLDSCIALSPGKPTRLSGPLSKDFTHYLRTRHDAILVGVGTAIADDPGLNSRLADHDSLDQQPQPVVLDPHGRWGINRDSRVVRTAREGRGKGPWIIFAEGVEYPPTQKSVVEECGGRVISVPLSDEMPELKWVDILKELKKHGISSLMVEGGARVINDLLRDGNKELVSSLVVTIAPVFLGTGAVNVSPPQRKDGQTLLSDVAWHALGEDMIMCGRIK